MPEGRFCSFKKRNIYLTHKGEKEMTPMDMTLRVLNQQSGERGFALVGPNYTVEADMCRNIGQGISEQKVGIEVNAERTAISIMTEGLSINFPQEAKAILFISTMLSQGSIRVEPYADGESSGCMVVSR
jgi:hypothetical protein